MQICDSQASKSIVIMDNFSIHHVDEVAQLFNDVGIIVLFLPPYSPDIMVPLQCICSQLYHIHVAAWAQELCTLEKFPDHTSGQNIEYGYIGPGHGARGKQRWIVNDDDLDDM